MLTRIEVDGFKNLFEVAIDFGPYACIAGPNAVGKSNLFDCIQFVARLADKPFLEAAQELRSGQREYGDPRALFYFDGSGYLPLRIACELIVPRDVEDDFGQPTRATMTYLRYELELRYVEPVPGHSARVGGILLVREELRHINKGEAPNRLHWKYSAAKFRDVLVTGRRSGIAYISTSESDDGESVIKVHQDGGSRGQTRQSPAARAPRTMVSTTTTKDDPTIMAARREMQSWKLLTLEPTAMRDSDPVLGPTGLGTDGSHIASTLYRLESQQGPDVYARVASLASRLTDIRQVRVDVNAQRDLLTLEVRLARGPFLPARSLSDGTLRFLALCVLAVDPAASGLICMEEPENGIAPGRIREMVQLVRDLAVDPMEEPGPENPVRQVIVNTHSPFFVQYQDEDDLLFAAPKTLRRRDAIVQTVEFQPLVHSWRARVGTRAVVRNTIKEYLSTADGAHLTLGSPID